MYIDMNCSCTASLSVDSEDNDTLVMLWANQFINAHQSCGYILQPAQEVEEKTKRYDGI